MAKLVCGVGINDIPRSGSRLLGGLPNPDYLYYSLWGSVLGRSCSEAVKARYLSYGPSEVIDGWKVLSAFKAWVETQNHQGLSLDKDILVQGNKLYGPDTCVFVPAYINTCLTMSNASRGDFPIGVSISKAQADKGYSLKFVATITNKRYGKAREYLGHFKTPQEAHSAWQRKKIEILTYMIEDYAKEPSFRTDVADALMVRVWKLQLENFKNTETTEL